MPIMVTRLMLSLKKAANSPVWSFGDTGRLESIRFARNTIGGTNVAGGNISLGRVSSKRQSSPLEP